jgi:hypothetical protein
MLTRPRLAAATAATASLLAIGIPVGSAQAMNFPGIPAAPCGPGMNTFVPPAVGPITVDLGPTIIQGKVMNPGLHVSSPGTNLPTLCWKPPPLPLALHLG